MPPSKQHTNYHKILKLISKMRTNIYLRIKPQWSAQYQCLFIGSYCLQLYNQLLHHLRITMYLLLTNKSSSHPQGYRNKIKKAF